MKKAILFVLALILLSAITNADESEKNFLETKPHPAKNGTCFDEHTHLINVGIGFGGGNYYRRGLGNNYVYTSTPAFSITYEQAYPKN